MTSQPQKGKLQYRILHQGNFHFNSDIDKIIVTCVCLPIYLCDLYNSPIQVWVNKQGHEVKTMPK